MTRIAVIKHGLIKPYWEDQPSGWEYTGAPSLMLIDADNEEHWQRFVWSAVAYPEEGWMGTTREELLLGNAKIPERSHGYELGYYPREVENDWEIIPDGPYCAACVDPRDDMEGALVHFTRHNLPQAWDVELVDSPNDGPDGYEDRCCTGCGAVLYAAENWS